MPGQYNVLNAAAAYAVAIWLGVDDADIRRQLARYQGTYRRFQLIGAPNNIRVYDDYAHHPTEVLNTLIAARTGVGAGRVVVCFNPTSIRALGTSGVSSRTLWSRPTRRS